MDPATIPGMVVLPLWTVVAVIVTLCGAISYLVAWIRQLYRQRIEEQAEQISRRDSLLERVLAAVSLLAEAMKLFQERAR